MEGNGGQHGQLATTKVHLGSNSSEVLPVLGPGPSHGAPSSHLKPAEKELELTDGGLRSLSIKACSLEIT